MIDKTIKKGDIVAIKGVWCNISSYNAIIKVNRFNIYEKNDGGWMAMQFCSCLMDEEGWKGCSGWSCRFDDWKGEIRKATKQERFLFYLGKERKEK